MHSNTLSESLQINITEIGDDYIKGTMPVNGLIKQPFGLLHGGASVALSETSGSIASWLMVNPELFIGVGIEINANHIKAVKEGFVTAICKPIHVTGMNHIWEIKIYNNAGELTCISRFAELYQKQRWKQRNNYYLKKSFAVMVFTLSFIVRLIAIS